jgi:hypothetical protein
MNLPSSLKARLVEILIELPPGERKIVVEELKEVVRIICEEEGFSLSESSIPLSRSGPLGGLIFWN